MPRMMVTNNIVKKYQNKVAYRFHFEKKKQKRECDKCVCGT